MRLLAVVIHLMATGKVVRCALSPLITVNDVEASSRWYQRLLGCRSAHGGPHYERLIGRGMSLIAPTSTDDTRNHGGCSCWPYPQRPGSSVAAHRVQ